MKQIPYFPNYSITKDGRVWSKPRQRTKGGWLKPKLRNNYLCVDLCKNGNSKVFNIHRLVLETYVGPCPKGMECRHLNGNPVDNRFENLCWGTHSDNQKDCVKHGTHVNNSGGKNGNSKLTERDARMIVYMGQIGIFTHQEIANIFHINRTTITNIINKKIWKHIFRKEKHKC